MINISKIADLFTENVMKILEELDNIPDIQNAFRGRGIGKSQLDILLRAVRKANCIEEIKLFIKYQSAKASNGNSWNTLVGQNKISDVIIEKINQLIGLVSNEVIERENLTTDDVRILKLKLSEKFFGYLYWKGTVYSKEG